MTKILDKLLGMVSLIGAAMLMVPLSILLLGVSFPDAVTVMPVLAVLFTFLGYYVQSLNAKVQKKRASLDGFSSIKEGVLSGYKMKYAAMSYLILILLAVPLTFLYDLGMKLMLQNAVILYYDSIYPVLFDTLYFLSSAIGVVMWFYPVSRLSNVYVVFAGAILFYAETFFVLLMSYTLGSEINYISITAVIGIPFVIFNICVLLIFNQSNLQKHYKGSVVSVMTPSARIYNMFLVFLVILLFLAVSWVVYTIFSGFWLIIKSIIYVALFRIFNSSGSSGDMRQYDYVDSDEARAKFSRDVLSGNNGDGGIVTRFVFVIAVIAIIVIGIKTGWIFKVIKRIREWFADVINTFVIGRDIFKNAFNPAEDDETYNYKDEKKRIQNAAVRDYDLMAEQTDDYKYFMQQLGRMKNYDEQLCYAYTVLLKMYRKINISFKNSDTPREVEGKVSRAMSDARIKKITADFEKVHYAEIEPDDREASEILGNICEEVKRYMY
ncbi:MAG: hypothetical protein ACI4XJ_06255 [Eubacteriales bacterium]